MFNGHTMINLSRSDSDVATESNHWLPLSQTSLNINSLSATKSGGICDRFAKVLQLICFLLNISDILHLQDIRIPDDSFISCLNHALPNYSFIASANDTRSAGVVTIYKTSLRSTYDISHEILHTGHILSSTFEHRQTNNSFTTINTYLRSNLDQPGQDS